MSERNVRTALINLITAAGMPQLLVVHAPAGFGKTSLLETLVAGRRDAVWIDGRAPEAAAHGLAESIGPDVSAGPCVLDEPERLPADIRAELIERGLRRATSAHPLMIATRRLDSLPIARWLASDRAVLIRADQLLMSREDVSRLCERRLARARTTALFNLTRGWPAATMLILRWMEAGGAIDPSGAYLLQSGMAAYLDQEVFAGLPATAPETLMLAGICEGMPADMLDALDPDRVLASDYAALAAILPSLMNLANGLCGLHPILSAHASARLAAAPRAEREAWLLRGADWLAGRQELIAAARLASRAGAGERIVDYISAAGGLRLWMDGKIEQVAELVALAGEDAIDAKVELRLLRCAQMLKEGRVAEAERLFMAACRDLPDDPAARREARIVQIGLSVYGCRVDSEVDLGSVEDTDEETSFGWMWPTLRLVNHAQAGDFGSARADLVKARQLSRAESARYNLMFLNIHDAQMELARGALDPARKAMDRARRQWRREFPDDRGVETVIAATAAQLEFECGRTIAARNQLRIAQGRLPNAEAWLDIYVASHEPLIRLTAADDGLPAALATIEATGRTLTRRGLARIADLLRALAAIVAGERSLSDASVAIPQLPTAIPEEPDGLPTWQEREFFWLAHAYGDIAGHRIEAAIARLGKLCGHARDRGLRRTELRSLLLLVAAFDRARREDEATASFEKALAIGVATGQRRAFVEFGGPAVLDRLMASDERAFAAAAVRGTTRKPTDTVAGRMTFTSREVEILRALRGGGSDKVVARRVGLSEHGVRFHLKNMFRKLAVHDRVAMIDAARRAGIDPT